jgi:hypothetical protein
MKKRVLRNHCWKVYNYFNSMAGEGSESIIGLRGDYMYYFCTEITAGNFPKILKFEDEHEEDLEEKEGGYPLENLCAVAFAVGFCLSEMFEVPHPKFGKEIEAIGRGLKEMKVLPYLPREKKGESHEEERDS